MSLLPPLSTQLDVSSCPQSEIERDASCMHVISKHLPKITAMHFRKISPYLKNQPLFPENQPLFIPKSQPFFSENQPFFSEKSALLFEKISPYFRKSSLQDERHECVGEKGYSRSRGHHVHLLLHGPGAKVSQRRSVAKTAGRSSQIDASSMVWAGGAVPSPQQQRLRQPARR